MDSGSRNEDVVGYNTTTAKKARLQSMLSALLDDPILSDVPKKPTLADVDTLINLELGSAMKISVVKMDNTSFDVAVLNSATLKDLKMAIRKKINDIEQAQMGHRHISCLFILALCLLVKHVWIPNLKIARGISGLTFVWFTIMRSSLMTILYFVTMAYVTIQRSFFPHTSCLENLRNILGEENIASSDVCDLCIELQASLFCNLMVLLFIKLFDGCLYNCCIPLCTHKYIYIFVIVLSFSGMDLKFFCNNPGDLVQRGFSKDVI
nr:uncharacterized protein LOC105053764 isoform X2 [Elaeis guineensis]